MHAQYTAKNVFMNAILLLYIKTILQSKQHARQNSKEWKHYIIGILPYHVLRLISCRLFHLSHTSLHVSTCTCIFISYGLHCFTIKYSKTGFTSYLYLYAQQRICKPFFFSFSLYIFFFILLWSKPPLKSEHTAKMGFFNISAFVNLHFVLMIK